MFLHVQVFCFRIGSYIELYPKQNTFLTARRQDIFFTKRDLLDRFEGRLETMNSRIRRSFRQHQLLRLKNGLYIGSVSYLDEPDKVQFAELTASQMCQPSYLSLEYVLESYQVLPLRSTRSITSVTSKGTRSFTNAVGSFRYLHVKSSMYFGFEEVIFHGYRYHIATKAKALFDYLYLRDDLDCRNEKRLYRQLFETLGLQWGYFSEGDFEEFDSAVWRSNSFKMMMVRRIIERYFEGKKFDRWKRELLGH